jgi:cytochrome c556|tara:strand:+ start:35 stop:484 length:450 start_codon:yes stop_codon:yes gene_type:complete
MYIVLMKLVVFFLIFTFSLIAHEEGRVMGSEVIEERKISMQLLNKLMNQARKNINDNDLGSDTTDIFSQIQNILNKYPSLFPDDSFDGKTKASTDIISNRDKFNSIAKEYEDNAKLIIELIESGDSAAVNKSFQNLYSSCKSCHSRFRN